MNNGFDISTSEKLKNVFNTPDEKSAIKVACRQVLASLNLRNAPIPLKPVCQRFNLKIIYNNLEKSEDSFLRLAPNGFEIEISKQKNWRRNRFTIAHELAHLILFSAISTPINSFDKDQHDEVEKLCDIGASELLISEFELEKYLCEVGLNTSGLKFLYDKFLVSYEALFLKLSDFLNANIIIWKKYARHQREQSEFRVYRHFPSYKYAVRSTWLPDGCTTKHIAPIPFTNTECTIALDDFKVLMNGKSTSCHSLSFLFPHTRVSINNLPTFDNLIVTDESTFDDCFIMFVFSEKRRFEKSITNYLK